MWLFRKWKWVQRKANWRVTEASDGIRSDCSFSLGQLQLLWHFGLSRIAKRRRVERWFSLTMVIPLRCFFHNRCCSIACWRYWLKFSTWKLVGISTIQSCVAVQYGWTVMTFSRDVFTHNYGRLRNTQSSTMFGFKLDWVVLSHRLLLGCYREVQPPVDAARSVGERIKRKNASKQSLYRPSRSLKDRRR